MSLLAAHQFQHPKVLRVGVLPDRLLINVGYDVSPGEDARLHRSLFDRDQNGTLDPEEKKKLEQYLVDTAMLFMRLSINGEKVVPERTETQTTKLDLSTRSTDMLGVAFVLSAPLPADATFTVELGDRDKDRSRHVPVTVDLAPGFEVVFSSPGELFPEVRQLHRIMLKEGEPLVLRLRRTRAT